jgi:hypothetical protein
MARKKTWLMICHLFTVTRRVLDKLDLTADAGKPCVAGKKACGVRHEKKLLAVVIC